MADQQQQQETKKATSVERQDVSQNGSQIASVEPGDLEGLTQYVQELMQQMQGKFTIMSEQILGRIDEMSHRMEDLERNLNDISTHAGLETTPTNSTTGIPPSPNPAQGAVKEDQPQLKDPQQQQQLQQVPPPPPPQQQQPQQQQQQQQTK